MSWISSRRRTPTISRTWTHAARLAFRRPRRPRISANQLATTANTQAGQASAAGAAGFHPRDRTLNTTVSNLDQYAPISGHGDSLPPRPDSVECKGQRGPGSTLRPSCKGRRVTSSKCRATRGHAGEAGIANSQHMADAVVRYLVVEHKFRSAASIVSRWETLLWSRTAGRRRAWQPCPRDVDA